MVNSHSITTTSRSHEQTLPYSFRDPQQAFQDAIDAGHLSEDRSSPYYASHYMYMFSGNMPNCPWRTGDAFKHRMTRRYFWVRHRQEAQS